MSIKRITYDNFQNDPFINELDINDKIIFHPFGAYYKNNSKNLHDINFPREVYFQNGVFT